MDPNYKEEEKERGITSNNVSISSGPPKLDAIKTKTEGEKIEKILKEDKKKADKFLKIKSQ